MAFVVGITGTIGSGKSAVGEILKRKGQTVIDTDQVVHDLLAHDSGIRDAIRQRFGDEVLDETKTAVDRKKLGAIVFAHEQSRRDLEKIVHPATIETVRQMVEKFPADKPVFLLVPLLFEVGLSREYHRIWNISADQAAISKRLKESRGYSDQEINRRRAAQWTQAEKEAQSDAIIDNSGSLENTASQIDRLLQNLPSTTRRAR